MKNNPSLYDINELLHQAMEAKAITVYEHNTANTLKILEFLPEYKEAKKVTFIAHKEIKAENDLSMTLIYFDDVSDDKDGDSLFYKINFYVYKDTIENLGNLVCAGYGFNAGDHGIRHLWWGERLNGYLYYPNVKTLQNLMKELEEMENKYLGGRL